MKKIILLCSLLLISMKAFGMGRKPGVWYCSGELGSGGSLTKMGDKIVLYGEHKGYASLGVWTGEKKLLVYELQTYGNPRLVSTFSTPLLGNVYSYKNIIYGAETTWNGGTGNNLVAIDFSDVKNPVLNKSPQEGSFRNFVVQGERGFSACQNNLNIFDLSDPAAPKILKTLSGINLYWCVGVYGKYIYIASRTDIKIYTLNESDELVLEGSLPTLASQFKIQENKLLFMDTAGLVHVYDLTNPKNPLKLTSFSQTCPMNGQCGYSGGLSDFYISGNYFYTLYFIAGLVVQNIENISSPQTVANYALPFAKSFVIDGDNIYVASGSSQGFLSPASSVLSVIEFKR